jgi:hypothetical protein
VTSFSLIIDEITDVAVKKQLAVTVLFCNKEVEIQVDLLDMVQCCDVKEKTVFKLICNVLR